MNLYNPRPGQKPDFRPRTVSKFPKRWRKPPVVVRNSAGYCKIGKLLDLFLRYGSCLLWVIKLSRNLYDFFYWPIVNGTFNLYGNLFGMNLRNVFFDLSLLNSEENWWTLLRKNEKDYKKVRKEWRIVFCNLPLKRFGSILRLAIENHYKK